MQNTVLVDVLTPMSLGLIMLSLGLSLTLADFQRVLRMPKTVAVGLLCQLLVLPALGFLIATIFSLSPEYSVGLVLLCACGGGAVSNALAHLVRADTALSVTLTSISLPISAIGIPFWTGVAIDVFMASSQAFSLPLFDTMFRLVLTLWLPIGIGMFARFFYPVRVRQVERAARTVSVVILFALLGGVFYSEYEQIGPALRDLAGATWTLNVAALGAGFAASWAVGLPWRSTLTIGIEVGIQNSATAIFVALTALGAPLVSVPAAVYTLVAFGNFGILMIALSAGRAWMNGTHSKAVVCKS